MESQEEITSKMGIGIYGNEIDNRNGYNKGNAKGKLNVTRQEAKTSYDVIAGTFFLLTPF